MLLCGKGKPGQASVWGARTHDYNRVHLKACIGRLIALDLGPIIEPDLLESDMG
jgi:hypothetical protein